MIDETETIRRNLVAEINLLPGSREALEAAHGKVYDTSELQEEFQALGVHGPVHHRSSSFVVVVTAFVAR